MPPIASPVGVRRARERIIESAVVVRPEHEHGAPVDTEGFVDEVTELVVAACLTVWVRMSDVLVKKLVSPP